MCVCVCVCVFADKTMPAVVSSASLTNAYVLIMPGTAPPPKTQTQNAIPVTTSALTCPKCGTGKSGKRSCCVFGGAWYRKCGDGPLSDHTYFEGIKACRSESAVDTRQRSADQPQKGSVRLVRTQTSVPGTNISIKVSANSGNFKILSVVLDLVLIIFNL